MQRHSSGRPAWLAVFAGIAALTLPSHAGQTRTWTQADSNDFEKGNRKNLSLRSDGLVTLAPRFEEIYDTSSAYLWALARDSKGTLYAGGGPGAKLYRLSAGGEKKTLADLEGLQIPAIAVDAKDRVYAATAPDGKVYRVSPDGKSEVFFDPKAKYIWALAFDKQGDLLIGTGDPGSVQRVKPDGQGSVLYQSDQTHVRSMTLDNAGNVILGTDPGGLVVRVSPAGEGFVLYQMSKKEVSAVAVAKDGSIYAAGVGSKGASSAPPPPPAPAPAAPATTASGSQLQLHPSAPPPASMTPSGSGVSVTGSDVFRIDANGNPQKIWTHSQDIVYAIAFDAQNRVLLGSGNKGYIYRIDSEVLHTTLVDSPSTQITAFQAGAGGVLYAATGNVGKIYQLGPALAREGSLESDVFDAGSFSQWGRLSFEANLNGGGVTLTARSGNLDQPQKNWSPWSAPVSTAAGGRLSVPAARFVQWKATLTGGGSAQSPELESVDVAYLPKNVPPRVEVIESTPPNFKFPSPSISVSPSQTLTLPAIGKQFSTPQAGDSGAPSMLYAKGFTGARWAATDDNGDGLIFCIEIRGEHETSWKPLKDKVKEKYWSWDSTAFPDGEYRIRVTASDLLSNPPGEALSTSMVSAPFLIDNTPPRIANLTAPSADGKLHATWTAADALSNIKKADYSLDGGDWTIAAPVTGLSDSHELNYDLTIDHVAAGEHTLAVRVEDEYDNQAIDKVVLK